MDPAVFYEAFVPGAVIGGIAGAILAFIIITVLLIFLGFYIYFSFAWMSIAKKLKFKDSYIAWIPFARSGMVLHLGGFPWALAFLYLVPILGWIAIFILLIIAKWRIFEKRKYSGALSLLILIPWIGIIAHAIVLGIVAWDDKNKKS